MDDTDDIRVAAGPVESPRCQATGLGSGMAYGKIYNWYIRAFRGSDSYGTSYYYREVTFQAGNAAGSESSREGELISKSGFDPRWPDGSLGVAEKP